MSATTDGPLGELLANAASFVEGGGVLPSIQVAVAHRGKVIAARTFATSPDVSDRTLYTIFSCTKAITASAAWLLEQDGKLDVRERVVDVVPEFGTNGKDVITVEQLLTHTCGFPVAPFAPLDWNDREKRLARFAKWRLDWEPGSRFVYHAMTSFWVLAEVIERRAGQDFRAYIRERIFAPLGLTDLFLGDTAAVDARVADVVHVGDRPAPEALAALGLSLPASVTDDEKYFEAYNQPAIRAVGAPASGGVATASALALFYQGLLHDLAAADGEHRVWRPATIARALAIRTGELIDPMTRRRAHRGLGVVVAGDDDKVYRGFGSATSSEAFGHPGAGGQVAWADPASGLSFVCLTNGFDRDAIRLGMRGVVLSTLAAQCAPA